MTLIIVFIISMIFVAICFWICIREAMIAYYNPIPKFDDGDGDEYRPVPFAKTRRISARGKEDRA